MKQRLLNILLITILLAFLWSIFFIARFLLREERSTIHYHVPAQASFAIEFDGRAISASVLTSTLFETRDQEIIELVEESLLKKAAKETQIQKDGIHYLAPTVFFQLPYNGRVLNGWLVNVDNEDVFLDRFTSNTFIAAVNDGVGIVMRIPNSLRSEEKALRQLANQSIKSVQKSPLLSVPANENGQIIRLFLGGKFWGSEFKEAYSFVRLILSDDAIVLKGELLGEAELEKKTSWSQLKPKGFHISSSLLPPSAIDSLNKITSTYGLRLPALSGFSMNYFGTKIIAHSGGVIAVPQMELILHCTKPFKVDTLVSSKRLQSFFKYSKLAGKLHWDDEDLYYRQIDSRTVYLGINEFPAIYQPDPSRWLYAKGSVAPLLAVDGGEIVQALLEMLPVYRSSQAWSKSMKDMDVAINRNAKGRAELTATIRMQPGKKPLNELIKFVLTSQLVD